MIRERGRDLGRWLRVVPGLIAVCVVPFAPVNVSAAQAAAVEIGGGVHAVAGVDVDHDGAGELVLVRGDAGSAARTIEIWDYGRDGWRRAASGPVARPDPGGGPARAIDGEAESIALLAWRDEGGARALLALGGEPEAPVGGCCLDLATVDWDGATVALRFLDGPGGPVESAAVLDTDDDGIDEILVTEPRSAAGDRLARLLRWTGNGFESTRFDLGRDDGSGRPIRIGESDGRPGDEAIYAIEGGRILLRIGASEDGTARVERTAMTDATSVHIWTWGAAGGRIVAHLGTELRVLEWPRGGEPTTVASRARPEFPVLHVVGTTSEAVIIDEGIGRLDPRGDAVVSIHALDLELIGDVPAPKPVRELWRLASLESPALRSQVDSLDPYVGLVPGSAGDGQARYLAAGTLITVGPDGAPLLQPSSSLTGRVPLGIVGPDDAWWIIGRGHLGPSDPAFFVGNRPAASVSLVPEALVLQPDAELPPLDATLDGATLVEGPGGVEQLAVPDGGFDLVLRGIAGSRVVGVVDQWVVHEGRLPDEPVSLAVRPLRRGTGNQPIEVAVVVVDPAGRASFAHWEGEGVREPPEIVVGERTHSFALRSTISGRASRGAAVTVDGAPVALNALGDFRIEIDAPIWPRAVRVVARDAIGNEAAANVYVLGFLDYRGLPWAAIVGLATLGSGVILFLRTPRRRVREATRDDARLEEMDGG